MSLSNRSLNDLLTDGGWAPDRRVPDRVAEWRGALEQHKRFVMHPAAEAVLLEFGGLKVGSTRPGVQRASARINFDPMLAVGEEDRLLDYFPALTGLNLFPLGEVDDGHAFFAISASGETFCVGDEIYGRWPTFRAALEALLLGRT